MSNVNWLLPKTSRHTFEGNADFSEVPGGEPQYQRKGRTMLSPDQVTKLEATLLCEAPRLKRRGFSGNGDNAFSEVPGGRPSSFQDVTEWGTPWLHVPQEREEQGGGRLHPSVTS